MDPEVPPPPIPPRMPLRNKIGGNDSGQDQDANELWNFSWIVRGTLCACACPSSEEEIGCLRRIGVKVIVSLSEDCQPHESARNSMDCYVIPVVEFEPPSMEDIVHFIDICSQASAENKPVCVHCREGVGRTGVMLACYIVKQTNRNAREAIDILRRMRRGSIETSRQEKAVEEFKNYIS